MFLFKILLFSMAFISSYFIGNFCAAIIISNTLNKKDIRTLGSTNAGTTNMLRTFGIRYGLITFVIDFGKGYLCTLLWQFLFIRFTDDITTMLSMHISGLLLILGHNYPLIFNFKGGKGFATAIGVYLVINPIYTLYSILIALFILFIVDRMSVCALTFFTTQVIFSCCFYLKGNLMCFFSLIYLMLAIISHWPNIIRLVNQTEPRLYLFKKNRK